MTQTLSCLVLESKSNLRRSRGWGMLQLYTRYIFKSKFLCLLSRTTWSLLLCVLSPHFLSEETYHKLQASNSFTCLLFLSFFFFFSFFFLNHCHFLQTPSKPNRHEYLYIFYKCLVSIVRTAPEHSERSKALAAPRRNTSGCVKGTENLPWTPRPFAHTAGFLQVRHWCIPLLSRRRV